jgi:hypothetical protein
MTSQEFRQLLDRLATGWAKRDYAAVAQEFSEDVRYGDPTRYSFDNRRDLQKFFENDEGCEQRTTWHTVIFDEAQQLGVAEYTYEGNPSLSRDSLDSRARRLHLALEGVPEH